MDNERLLRSKKRAIAKRAALFERIKAVSDLGELCESDTVSREKFLEAVNDLSSLWAKFVVENDTLLDVMVDLDEVQDFSNALELEASNLVLSVRSLAKRLTCAKVPCAPLSIGPSDVSSDVLGSAASTSAVPVKTQKEIAHDWFVRLPELPLPRFEGSLTDWPLFRDRFLALVDSRSVIPNIEKFYYLLNCLGAEASEVVKGITVSNETYSVAWSALVERYDQPRRLASSILDKMLSATALAQESVATLNRFLSTFDEGISVLESLQIPDLGDFLLFSVAFRTLPVCSRRLFETTNTDEYPKSRDLFKFIKGRIQVLELAGGNVHPSSTGRPFSANLPKVKKEWVTKDQKATSLMIANTPETPARRGKPCPGCNGSHNLKECAVFINSDLDGRFDIVSSRRLCMSCFSDQHWSNKCKDRCSKCQRRHHILLHRDVPPGQSRAAPLHLSKEQNSSQKESAQSPTVLLSSRSTPAVLLGTVLVLVQDATGEVQPVRAVLDSGSQISAISASCSDRLGLRPSKWTASVSGLAGHGVTDIKGIVQIAVRSRHEAAQLLPVTTWVLPQITSSMPSRQLATGIRESFSHLQLADPSFDSPAPVDLLLGADVFSRVWIGKKCIVSKDLPTAYSSVFGWILIGPIQQAELPAAARCMIASVDTSIEALMEKFWKIEEPEEAPLQFTDEGKCEAQFSAEVVIDETGRYSVPLPFRQAQPPSFGDMHKIAARRFVHLERKLEQDEILGAAYRQFMAEYETLGHMTISKIPGQYIIPHHAIWKSNGDSGKLRVVFDASACGTTGQSLNSSLFVGPKLQRDIIDVLLGFRTYRFAFSSDICKMYRQILVNPEYRKYQSILWRATPTEPLKEYTLNTVTYGVSSAPYLALRVLHDMADRRCTHSPAVQNAIRLQTYMDDICSGANSLKEAQELQQDLVQSLRSCGFELKKWSSNTPELLKGIPWEDCASGSMSFEDDKLIVQVLGIKWKPEVDQLGYDFSSIQFVFTKRGVLSVIARIFDPLGFLSPVVFLAKNLMQMIWCAGIAWDDQLPVDIFEAWSQFVNELPSLSLIRVPRFVETHSDSKFFLCGFCDASVRGYAALAYICVVRPSGEVIVHLLGGKTKLAPLRDMTIPRLELCAAGLLARWLSRIKSTLAAQLTISGVYAWTDSSIVLSWLTNPHDAYKVFVSNRVHQVQQLLPECNWRHVSSEENPADCASRGLQPSELAGHTLYWQGPRFLLQGPTSWVVNVSRIPIDQLPEVKVMSLVASLGPQDEWFERFSSYQRMLRIVAWMYRFIFKCRRLPVVQGPLMYSELDRSVFTVARCAQRIHFPVLFRELSRKVSVSSRQLARLAPFIDPEGLIRVGGRLRNAQVSERQKHPILLAKGSYLSKLLASHWHIFSCHSGTRLIMSLVLKQFWILSARRVIGQVIKECSICVRLAAVNSQPLMADLPPSRVLSCRSFAKVGIDYAGPFRIRETRLRKAREFKIYVSVFVCMTVKAVHLELVSDLSTPAFLAALDRFVARRGLPSDIYSDCGTNFVGASKELRKIMLDTGHRHQLVSHIPCSWHFNPPSAPHFGGLWEAAVKSMKRLLIRVIGSHTLTYEEFNTILCRVEAVMNSRPLTSMSQDPNDLECLTPGHFLIGQPLLAIPDVDAIDATSGLLSRWKLLHQCHRAFWKRWSSEYLAELQLRNKWTSPDTRLGVGDIVVVKDSSAPPLTWRLGRVCEVLPGPDKVVRVVKVLTQSGTVTRPVVKLVRLPSNSD